MVFYDILHLPEPEDREFREHLSLVRDPGGKHNIKG